MPVACREIGSQAINRAAIERVKDIAAKVKGAKSVDPPALTVASR